MDPAVMESLSHDAKTIIAYVQFEFDKMKTELTDTVNSKNLEIENLKSEVASLQNQVLKLENLVDESDAYERRDTLIFSGPAIPLVSQTENCSNLIQKLAKDELNCIVSPTDISTAHRLGKKPISQRPDRRSIIVKFCRRDVKHQLYAARKNQPRDAQVYVNESLTPARQEIFHTLRKIRKSNPGLLNGVSTFDGNVYAYTKNETTNPGQRDRRHRINSSNMLKMFCDEFLKRPLRTFLDSFAQ